MENDGFLSGLASSLSNNPSRRNMTFQAFKVGSRGNSLIVTVAMSIYLTNLPKSRDQTSKELMEDSKPTSGSMKSIDRTACEIAIQF